MTFKPFREQGNFTALHNFAFDIAMPELSASAWKILCLVIRRTTGWGKKHEALSYPEIMEGTGIQSSATVSKALQELLSSDKFGSPLLLRKEHPKQGKASHVPPSYALNLDFKPTRNVGFDALENEAYASKNEASDDISRFKNQSVDALENEASTLQKMKRHISKETKEREEKSSRARRDTHTHTGEEPNNPQGLNCADPVIASLCEVSGLPKVEKYLDLPTKEALRNLVATLTDLSKLGGADLGREVRRRLTAPAWKFETPPHLSQIVKHWERQGAIADTMERNKGSGGGENPAIAATQATIAAIREKERLAQERRKQLAANR